MLEALPLESSFGLVPENQVRLGQRRVPAKIPSLADLEVAEKFLRYVRADWNRHQGIEQFLGLFEVTIELR